MLPAATQGWKEERSAQTDREREGKGGRERKGYEEETVEGESINRETAVRVRRRGIECFGKSEKG